VETARAAGTEQARKTKQARNWVGLSLRFTVSALALTLLVLVALIVRHRTQADQADNFAVRPFANDKTLQSSPAISPDGTTVAYVRYSGDGTSQIMLRTLDGTRTRSLTQGKVLDLNPSWSPNGESIAFLRVQGEAAEIVVETIANRTERAVGPTPR
jgi:dipeptidyl aminopeptidase/acylaminoacyl peptidase